jgi:hypothetical protein
MLAKLVRTLPEGPQWEYELKLDGYRLEAIKHGSKVRLYSRRGMTVFSQAAAVDRPSLASRRYPTALDIRKAKKGLHWSQKSSFILPNAYSDQRRIHSLADYPAAQISIANAARCALHRMR